MTCFWREVDATLHSLRLRNELLRMCSPIAVSSWKKTIRSGAKATRTRKRRLRFAARITNARWFDPQHTMKISNSLTLSPRLFHDHLKEMIACHEVEMGHVSVWIAKGRD